MGEMDNHTPSTRPIKRWSAEVSRPPRLRLIRPAYLILCKVEPYKHLIVSLCIMFQDTFPPLYFQHLSRSPLRSGSLQTLSTFNRFGSRSPYRTRRNRQRNTPTIWPCCYTVFRLCNRTEICVNESLIERIGMRQTRWCS